jgi:hypothetical protein
MNIKIMVLWDVMSYYTTQNSIPEDHENLCLHDYMTHNLGSYIFWYTFY